MIKKLRLITAAILLLATVHSIAQPKNKGFELWTPQSGYDEPQNWQTMNLLSSLLFGSNPVSCFKTTDAHSGSYAMKIKTVKLTNNPFPAFISDTIGGVFTGVLNGLSLRFGYGDTVRPSEMNFWAKYTPTGSDIAYATITLRKRNGSKVDTVGFGFAAISGTITTYQKFVAPITYSQAARPDTIIITFSASPLVGGKVGSELYIDDVDYLIPVGINENTKETVTVSVFPNPAADLVTMDLSSPKATLVEIYDMQGKNAGNFRINNQQLKIDTSRFPSGFYTYKVFDKDNTGLTQGKFEIQR